MHQQVKDFRYPILNMSGYHSLRSHVKSWLNSGSICKLEVLSIFRNTIGEVTHIIPGKITIKGYSTGDSQKEVETRRR